MSSPSVSSPSDSWLTIGRIVGAHGLQGEVKIYPDSDFPERFEQPGERWLRSPGSSEPQPVQLVRGRFQAGKGLYVVKFKTVNHRDQAEALRNTEVLVQASDRLPLEPDEFHVGDLMGLAVVMQATGETVGHIIDLYRAGNDLLEVQLIQTNGSAPQPSAATVLVPFVKAIVPVVDLEQRRVEITPPRGLIPTAEAND